MLAGAAEGIGNAGQQIAQHNLNILGAEDLQQNQADVQFAQQQKIAQMQQDAAAQKQAAINAAIDQARSANAPQQSATTPATQASPQTTDSDNGTSSAPQTTDVAAAKGQSLGNRLYSQAQDLMMQAEVHQRAGDAAGAKQLMDSANGLLGHASSFMPDVQSVETGIDPSTGKAVKVIRYKDGSEEKSDFLPTPDVQAINTGGKQVLLDKNTAQPIGALQNTPSPDAVLSAATQRRGQDIQRMDSQLTPTMKEAAAQYGIGTPAYKEFMDNYLASKTGTNGQGGGRAAVMNGRIVTSGNEVAKAMTNIANLPVSANTGFFGAPGQTSTLFQAGSAALKNQFTPDQVKDYNTMWTGVARSLGTLETSGLSVTQHLTDSIDKLAFVPTDNGYNALRKMAEVRQITEAALEPKLLDPSLTPDQKGYIKGIIDSMEKAVPFTHADLTKFKYQSDNNPAMTFTDFAQKNGLSGATPQAPTSFGKPQPNQSTNQTLTYDPATGSFH